MEQQVQTAYTALTLAAYQAGDDRIYFMKKTPGPNFKVTANGEEFAGIDVSRAIDTLLDDGLIVAITGGFRLTADGRQFAEAAQRAAVAAQNKFVTIFVVDGSGSMSWVRDMTREALNARLAELQVPQAGISTLAAIVVFDSTVKVIRDLEDVALIDELQAKDYHTAGGTALIDGIDMAISLANPLDVAGTAIVVSILTDGGENASRTTKPGEMARMIQERQDKGNWTFAIAGPNTVRQFAHNMGIPDGNVLEFEVQSQASHANAHSQMSMGLQNTRQVYAMSMAGGSSAGGAACLASQNFYAPTPEPTHVVNPPVATLTVAETKND